MQLLLQDRSGQIPAKLFAQEAERFGTEFEMGEFVAVDARTNVYRGRIELVVNRIRRVNPDQDRLHGFREEDCIPTAPRSADEMWAELEARIETVADPGLKVLLRRIATDYESRLRIWPAAQTIHHAYRSGLLEHILQITRVVDALGLIYDADRDLLFAGAMLHDIGKLEELEYDLVPCYSREGNLVGHIALGLMLVRQAAQGIAALSEARRTEVEHLIASHHGSLEFGSPVEPKTLEAFILAMADDLDAKLHQVRRHIAEDETPSEFTGFHPRLRRVLLKRSGE
jgi:3'-5' exoribonuclease